MQSPCRLCPRRCGARRAAGERGACGEGAAARVYRAAPHRGEEPPLSGVAGSGTVFFSGCTLRCVYCQNHPFSQGGGEELSAAELAGVFLALQAAGCHNLNLVTPTHVLPQILQALERAVGDGFALPVVYNTSGYETPRRCGCSTALRTSTCPTSDMPTGTPRRATRARPTTRRSAAARCGRCGGRWGRSRPTRRGSPGGGSSCGTWSSPGGRRHRGGHAVPRRGGLPRRARQPDAPVHALLPGGWRPGHRPQGDAARVRRGRSRRCAGRASRAAGCRRGPTRRPKSSSGNRWRRNAHKCVLCGPESRIMRTDFPAPAGEDR